MNTLSTYLQELIDNSQWLSAEVYLTGVIVFWALITPFLKSFIKNNGGLLSLVLLLPPVLIYANQFDAISIDLPLFDETLKFTRLSLFFKITSLVGATLFYIYYLTLPSDNSDEKKGEYHFLIFSTLLGINVVVMANNLLGAFLGLETISLASYALVLFGKDQRRPEAGLKYIILGAVSTAIMLFGVALLFALHGSLGFSTLFNAESFTDEGSKMITFLASIIFLIGVFFKLSSFPLHVWVPDVYQSVPLKLASFFSFGPKIAGLALLMNIISTVPDSFQRDLLIIVLGIVIVLTMLVGNLSALSQSNSKRLLAYSSIAHSGFLLVGLLSFSEFGIEATLFYTLVYLILNFSSFYLIDLLIEVTENEQIKYFSGLGTNQPLIGVLVVITMIGLTGLPPTIGFSGKVMVFYSLLESSAFAVDNILFWVLVIGLLNVAIALFFYLKIPYYLYFKESTITNSLTISSIKKVVAVFLVSPIILLFLFNDYILSFIHLFN
ncbi:NADH-quinone oxidoreductase subunit N [Cyclobacteriaceae bacterium]|nr:NADH-quinone oxidoreductase subunit N [Cyclobacteriaceae bacterium]